MGTCAARRGAGPPVPRRSRLLGRSCGSAGVPSPVGRVEESSSPNSSHGGHSRTLLYSSTATLQTKAPRVSLGAARSAWRAPVLGLGKGRRAGFSFFGEPSLSSALSLTPESLGWPMSGDELPIHHH